MTNKMNLDLGPAELQKLLGNPSLLPSFLKKGKKNGKKIAISKTTISTNNNTPMSVIEEEEDDNKDPEENSQEESTNKDDCKENDQSYMMKLIREYLGDEEMNRIEEKVRRRRAEMHDYREQSKANAQKGEERIRNLPGVKGIMDKLDKVDEMYLNTLPKKGKEAILQDRERIRKNRYR